MRVVITGATGFLGKALVDELAGLHELVAVARKPLARQDVQVVRVDDLSVLSAKSMGFLHGSDVVIHLAARAHILRETSAEPSTDYDRVNFQMTRELASAATAANVKHFVFLSTIGVHGGSSLDETRLYSPDSPIIPETDYARSKAKAEAWLLQHFSGSSSRLTIVRPPLIYGPNVRGNFYRLLRLAASRMPVPIGGVPFKRSLISSVNLASFLRHTIEKPGTGHAVYIPCDGEDLTTAQLIGELRVAMGLRPAVFPVPLPVLRLGARLLGLEATLSKMAGSLQVDSKVLFQSTTWRPARSLQSCVRDTVSWFLSTNDSGNT